MHAVDGEQALLAARNVFARRPSAASMWVAPEETVFSATAEELARHPERFVEDAAPSGLQQRYLVFRKVSHRQSLSFADHVGEVEAKSPAQALWKAVEEHADPPALAWWLVPEAAMRKSRDEDAESWFAPAETKTYKQQSAYGMTKAAGRRREPGA